MGIELPAELRDVAAKAGARWPEADEDRMRESASAWRDAASSLDGLARDADGSAQGALGAIEGGTAQAARRHWDGIVAGEHGKLPASTRECTAAADRLDHAAEQIGAAKVQMVRELVALKKNTDAAEQAAASGHPQALAGLDTVVRGASAGLAQVHRTLGSAVDIDSGVTVQGAAASPGVLGGAAHAVGGGAGHGIASTVDSAAGSVGATSRGASDLVGAAGHGASGGAGAAGHGASDIAHGASDAVGHVGSTAANVTGGAPEEWHGPGEKVDKIGDALANRVGNPSGFAEPAVPPGIARSGAEQTGPVSSDVVGRSTGVVQGAIDADTGPVPIIGRGQGWSGSHPDPGSITAPQAVHSAWASPPPAQPGFAPGLSGAPVPSPAPPPPQAPNSHFAPPSPAPAPPPVQGGARPPTPPPPPAAGRPPAPMYGSAPGAAQPQPQPFRQPPGQGAIVSGQPVQNQAPRAGYRSAPGVMPPAPQPAPPEAPQRPLRQGDRNPGVLAFVLHQFPIGHMPVAASHPSRQLPPPPAGDPAAGLRFPPQDHPRSGVVSDADALARVRSGDAQAAVTEVPLVRDDVPEEVVAAHEPFGDLSESDWEREFRLDTGKTHGSRHYRWPSLAGLPEGGVEPGEPVVLEPDTVVDGFGDGSGRVVAPERTAFAQRCLPPEHRERDYRRYRVMRRLPVWQAVAAPWFAQPGGGVRYRTTYALSELVALGYLVELTRDRLAMEAGTVRIPQQNVAPEASGEEQEAQG
jgi:hypothetical protein